jgi:hypothetical protein
MRRWFLFFCILLLRKILFKFLLASMKTLINPGDFTGSRIRTLVALQRKMETSIQPSQSSACDFEK